MLDVTRRVRTVTRLCMLVAALSSCNSGRPEPGSDLPEVPEASAPDVTTDQGAMLPGAALDGAYVAPTEAATTDGIVKVPLRFVFLITQSGDVAEGSATLSGNVYIDNYESRTSRPFADVPVSEEGRFRLDVEDMLIPKELNSLLTEDVTDTTVSFIDVQIATSCQFAGRMEATLRQVTSKLGVLPQVVVAGDFVALGSGTDCAADAGTEEVGP